MTECAACEVEKSNESPRFEEAVGMAWIRGFVEGAMAAANVAGGGPARVPGGFCEVHARRFSMLLEKKP